MSQIEVSRRLGQRMAWWHLMRPKQWVKNGFAFAPLLFSAEFLNLDLAIQAAWAVVLLCLASSAVYVLNDLQDIERDKQHPKKSQTRPLAIGSISIKTAKCLLVLLYALVLGIGTCFPMVLMVVLGYVVLNLAYTFVLKHQPVLDIFTIALGFILRVYVGAVAIQVPVSGWMFITTLCLALYLAAVKRRQELSQRGIGSRKVLEKYSVALVDRYAEMSSTGALVFYSMFVMSTKPQLLVTIPLVLFGLFRYWYVVESLEEGESPTDVLLADYQLLLTVGGWTVVSVWALWPI